MKNPKRMFFSVMLHILLTQGKLESSKVFYSIKVTWSPSPLFELHTDVLAFLGTFVNDHGIFKDALQVVSDLCIIFHSCSVLKALMQQFLVP